MLLDLGVARGTSGGVPPEWQGVVEPAGDGFIVRGDRTATCDLFLTAHGGGLLSDRIEEILDRLRVEGEHPHISPFAVTALVQSGLVPPPHSEFEGISTLTMGDVVDVSWVSGKPRLSFGIDYPWFAHKSRNDGTPSERRLLDLLTAATQRGLDAAGGKGFLMMSSGKDSAAVALALAEAGRTDIPCVTYSAGPDDPEPEIAAEICRRLGLEHHVVTTPQDPSVVRTMLTRFFEEAPRPGTDLKQIPYALTTASAGSDGGTVIDGGGNDSYMGFPVIGKWARKTQLRLRNRWLIDFVQRRTPVDSPVNYVARTRLETMLSGRLARFHEVQSFLPGAVDVRDFWAQLSQDTANLNLFDVYAFVERYVTPPASMKKHTLAARAIGHEASVPWCDHGIADYYFNLPEEHRLDRRRGVNKILLRRMLRQYLDYDADEIGKHYFTFDGARFVAENRELIRAEIDGCELWDRPNLGVVHEWLAAIEQRPLLHHAILGVFMVSGWHNHSRPVVTGTASLDPAANA